MPSKQIPKCFILKKIAHSVTSAVRKERRLVLLLIRVEEVLVTFSIHMVKSLPLTISTCDFGEGMQLSGLRCWACDQKVVSSNPLVSSVTIWRFPAFSIYITLDKYIC